MNTDFVFYWTVYSIHLQAIAKTASNLALDADIQGALPAVQTSLFVGNVQMTSRQYWGVVTCPVTFRPLRLIWPQIRE